MGIGWVINQEGTEREQNLIRFIFKVLNDRQSKYAQVKRILSGIVSGIVSDHGYIIRA